METMNMLRHVLVIALWTGPIVLAADFSGRWAGTIETSGSRVPIYLTLNQNDGRITGSVATGTALKQLPVEKTELREDQLSFEVHDNARRLMQFRLTLTDGVLGGEATVGSQVSKVGVVPAGGGWGGRLEPASGSVGSGVGVGVGSAVFRVGGGVSAPVLIHKVEPEYTEEARGAKYQGTVSLYAEISPDGTATNVRVLHGLGLGLNEKAIEAVKQWRFKPGEKDGKPVTVVATIEVNFRL
jgi:TonB family protein